MSRRRAGISPSLFPFLAVLICTLGTLILLLALVAQDAKEAAVAEAEHEKQLKVDTANNPKAIEAQPVSMTAEAADRMIEQEQFRASELVSYRDQQTAELDKKRDEITQIESHMRKVTEKLKSLNTEVETATAGTTKPATDIKTDEKTLLLMQEEAEKLRADIKELESSERGSKPRVVIVPHRGPNGTQRRPVYVICDADGLQVMPEGVRITKAQALAAAESDSPLSNPLGSALRVARRFAVQQYGDQEPPYPLLIVRPDGIYMYRVASALMKDWDDQYGYELVPGEVDLAFPGGDQVLRKDMEVAVNEAASRNHSFAGGGGFGGRARGSGDGEGFGYESTENSLAGNATGAGGDGASGMSGRSGSHVRSGSDPSNGVTDPPPQRALPTLSARELDRQAQTKGYSLARDQRFTSGGYAEQPGSQMSGYGSEQIVQSQSDALNEFLEAKSRPDGDDPINRRDGWNSDGGAFESPSTPGSQQGDSLAENASLDGSDGGPGGEGANGQAKISGGDSPTGTSANAAATMQQSQHASPASLVESTSSAQQKNGPNAVAMALSDAGQAGSPQSGSTSGSNDPPSSAQSPPASPQVAQNLVRPEGRDWALPDEFRGMGGTEFIRPISMRCQHDRYELVDQGRVVKTFPFGKDGIEQPTIELATAIRDRVANWGATMRGGYWKPRLEVSVGPYAEKRFREFEQLMQNSGVDVIRRTP